LTNFSSYFGAQKFIRDRDAAKRKISLERTKKKSNGRGVERGGKRGGELPKSFDCVNKCEAGGVKLIEIPHWWDNERPSLRATLHKLHPSLFSDPGDGTPIPEKAPPKITPGGEGIRGEKYRVELF